MNLQLEGKKALVTGASQGLGYATARGLALEGCAVAINSRNPKKLEAATRNLARETNSEVIAIPGDMTDPLFASELIQKTVEAAPFFRVFRKLVFKLDPLFVL